MLQKRDKKEDGGNLLDRPFQRRQNQSTNELERPDGEFMKL